MFGKVLISSEIRLNQTEVGGNRSVGISSWYKQQEKLLDSAMWFLSYLRSVVP